MWSVLKFKAKILTKSIWILFCYIDFDVEFRSMNLKIVSIARHNADITR